VSFDFRLVSLFSGVSSQLELILLPPTLMVKISRLLVLRHELNLVEELNAIWD
jgi:hypothetical protein